jgi:erythromycin esterase
MMTPPLRHAARSADALAPHLALVLLLTLVSCRFSDIPGLRQPAGVPIDTTTPPPPRSVQRWLDTTSATIRSIDFTDDDFRDLAPFGEAVGDASLVLLGEQSGGDGATLRAKARLVRYLHARRGFDVLVFESHIHEMATAWQAVTLGADANEAVRRALPEPWRDATELTPLLRWISEERGGPRPLLLAGMHPEFRGPRTGGTRADFVGALEAYLTANAIALPGTALWTAVRPRFAEIAEDPDAALRWSDADREIVADGLRALRTATTGLVNDVPESLAGFWITAVESLEAAVRIRDATAGRNPRLAEARRDSAMADVLRWLAQAGYPGQKLMVWTTSQRAQRAARELFNPLGAPVDHDRPVFGELVRGNLGSVTYSLAFLAGAGAAGPPSRPLIEPLPESWDGLFLATQKPFAFLNLRRTATADNVWIFGPRVARAMNFQQQVARWPLVYDGFFFMADMDPIAPRP